MAVTIKEIAKVAGVCHTTVSRALNDNPVISADTTARIQSLAREMGYVPNILARSLQTNKTRTIGIVLTTMTDPFLPRIVEGVEQVAHEANYSVFFSTSHNDPEREIDVIENLYRRRVDAIIIISMWVTSTYYDELSRIKVPIVLVNHEVENEGLYYVSSNDVLGAEKGVRHLIELGHRRIGFLMPDNRPTAYTDARLEGFNRAHQRAGLSVDPALVFTVSGESDVRRGTSALDELRRVGVTAVLCYNDLVAIGLLKACDEAGVKVPDELSVVGFDDLEMADYVSPRLTTLRQDRLKLGEKAMGMALDLLEGKTDLQNAILDCDLIIRGSTGPIVQVPV